MTDNICTLNIIDLTLYLSRPMYKKYINRYYMHQSIINKYINTLLYNICVYILLCIHFHCN